MKYIKRFNEEVKEKSIEDWCKEFYIKKYEIVDGLVNVNGGISMPNRNLIEIPIKFGIVDGYFYCYHNKLTSLEGGPKEVYGGFDCQNNKLLTLEGSPMEVGDQFYCQRNELTSLIGSPSKVGYSFNCSSNELTSLIDGPKEARGVFNCQNNKLLTLEGAPIKIYGTFKCENNPVYILIKLFGSFDKYKISIEDYKYLRGDKIYKKRLEKACVDAGIKMPGAIYGYEYI
jgi:hypothetical protein